MNELVFTKNNQAVTSSLTIAKTFNKEHRNVTRDIENTKKDVLNFERMFYETQEPDSYGRPRKVYLMNRDGFTILAMGFTGTKAMEFKMKYINEFNKMEEFMNSPEMIVQRAMEIQQERVKLLETENKELKPKATYHDLVLQSDTLISTSAIAKDLGLGAPTLNKLLNELGVQYKRGHRWYLYHNHQDKGYAQSKTWAVNAEDTKDHMYWTQKGKQFIFDLLERKEGIVPVTKTKELV